MAAAPRCGGKPATIVRGDGGVTVGGTARADVIVTGSGNDTISGGGAGDRICSGGGRDRIDGGKGNDKVVTGGGADTVDLALGRDRVELGTGADSSIGDRGDDWMEGGPGADSLTGELDDDRLIGGPGKDVLLGGLGFDHLFGAGGDDLLRGDRGGDNLQGGPGPHDLASYSSASAGPGRGVLIILDNGRSSDHYQAPEGERPGVSVDLDRGIARADGFGRADRLEGIEDVLGSAFADALVGGDGPNVLDGGPSGDLLAGQGLPRWGSDWSIPPGPIDPGDVALGGAGSDFCHWFTTVESCNEDGTPEPPFAPGAALAAVNDSVDGASLVVSAGPAINDISIAAESPRVMIVRDVRGVTLGEGCVRLGTSAARCVARSAITHIGVTAGANDDRVRIDKSVSANVTSRLLGELGDDDIVGGRGDDIVEGGPGWGYDALSGGAGNDAINAAFGADSLSGGPGNDLMIDENVCFGHTFAGGAGIDSVSFARSREKIVARLGGTVTSERLSPQTGFRCEVPDRISDDVEAFEGSPQDDVLYGNGQDNRIQGRKGNDKLFGLGGSDRLVGNEGEDALLGGTGLDRFLARDGNPDEVTCGAPGNDRVIRDAGDRLAGDCQ